MNDSIKTKNTGRLYLLVFILVLSDPGQASEIKNSTSLGNLEALQIDVRNNRVTGIVENKTLKQVLGFLSKKLGFILHSWDDLARHRVSLNYDQKDALAVLRDLLDEFNYVITTNSNLSIEKILILSSEHSQSVETEESDTLVTDKETPDQPLILDESSEDLVLPILPVSADLQVFDKEQFFEQLEYEMDI